MAAAPETLRRSVQAFQTAPEPLVRQEAEHDLFGYEPLGADGLELVDALLNLHTRDVHPLAVQILTSEVNASLSHGKDLDDAYYERIGAVAIRLLPRHEVAPCGESDGTRGDQGRLNSLLWYIQDNRWLEAVLGAASLNDDLGRVTPASLAVWRRVARHVPGNPEETFARKDARILYGKYVAWEEEKPDEGQQAKRVQDLLARFETEQTGYQGPRTGNDAEAVIRQLVHRATALVTQWNYKAAYFYQEAAKRIAFEPSLVSTAVAVQEKAKKRDVAVLHIFQYLDKQNLGAAAGAAISYIRNFPQASKEPAKKVLAALEKRAGNLRPHNTGAPYYTMCAADVRRALHAELYQQSLVNMRSYIEAVRPMAAITELVERVLPSFPNDIHVFPAVVWALNTLRDGRHEEIAGLRPARRSELIALLEWHEKSLNYIRRYNAFGFRPGPDNGKAHESLGKAFEARKQEAPAVPNALAVRVDSGNGSGVVFSAPRSKIHKDGRWGSAVRLVSAEAALDALE